MNSLFRKSPLPLLGVGTVVLCSVLGLNVVAQSYPPPVPTAAANRDPNNKYTRSYVEQSSKVAKLLAAYRDSTDEKVRASKLEELTAAVNEEFDARQKARESELMQLEEQLRKLRDVQKRRGQEKEQIVTDRVRQLVRDVDGLGWGSDSVDSSGRYWVPGKQTIPMSAGGAVK